MPSIKRILVPIDFSKCSRAALDYALDFAAPQDAAVEVVYVSEPNGYSGEGALALAPPPRGQRWEQTRQEILHEMNGFLGSQKSRIGAVHVHAGTAADVIADVAKDGEFDLVVMGSHGRSGVSRLLVGSVTESVMRKSTVPVLTLRLPVRQHRERIPL